VDCREEISHGGSCVLLRWILAVLKYPLQIPPVVRLAQFADRPLQSSGVDEALAKGDFLGTGDLEALTFSRTRTNSAASSRLSGVPVSSQA
jgi:hypothetical protein